MEGEDMEKMTKYEEGELMEQRRCRYLPQELVEPILRRSSLWASTRLQLVCKVWAAAGRAAVASHRTPWVFLYTVDHDGRTRSITGFMASICGDGGFFKVDTLGDTLHVGSCDGWLAFVESSSHRLFLLNPFTMARIELPSSARKVFYLCPSGDAARGCCVMESRKNGVAMWRPGQEDWEWREIRGWGGLCIRSVAAVNGVLYVMARAPESTVYRIDFAASALVPLAATGLPPPGTRGLRQLVESRGELLLAHCTRAGVKGVYRLDTGTKAWVRLRSLGEERTLFVTSSLVQGCPSAVAVEGAAGCRGDCVYLQLAGTGARWTVLDMAGGDPETLESSPRSLPVERMFRAVWVSPKLGFS